jgi:hypothetical protein
MQRTEQQPSIQDIQQTCRGIQQQWDVSERKRREQVALHRKRHLLEMLSGRHRNAVA